MEQEIFVQKITTEVEVNITFMREDLAGRLVLLDEQQSIVDRLCRKLETIEDTEVASIVQKNIDEVNENKRWNLIMINDLSVKLQQWQ